MSHKKTPQKKHALEERILEVISTTFHGSVCTSGDLFNRFCVKGKSAEKLHSSDELTEAISSLLSDGRIEDFGEGFFGLPRPKHSSESDLWDQSMANI